MIYKENKDKNKNFNINKNIFSVSIISSIEKYIERKSDIYYIIQITDNISNFTWEIEKSITDFQNLYEKIFLLHPKIPLIPKKAPFKITSLHISDKRQYELQNFLQFCLNRKDILLNKDFRVFIEIPLKYPKFNVNEIKKEEEKQFDLSVTYFLYIKNKSILIVLCSNNDFITSNEISIDNILLIRNNFSGKKSPLSYIFIYQYIKGEKETIFNILWEKVYFVRVEKIFFDESKEILCLGNDDGKIHLFQTKTKGEYNNFESIGDLSFHTDKISGLYLNSNKMELYSCSLDCMFFVSNLKETINDKSLIYNNTCGFTGLKYIKEYNIFLTFDEDGYILIFSFNNLYYTLFLHIQTTALDKLNSMFSYENFVITGGEHGKINIIDLSNLINMEVKEINSINFDDNKINCITYNSKKDEIIIGNEKGNIIIWNNKINNYICCWKGHTPYSVKHLWIDENYILWSSGDDKKIKMWKLPEKWFDDEIYLNSFNNEEKKSKKNIFDLGENIDCISSDEDEMNGWCKNL